MEDISRDLEREIAQSKPKPYKQDLKTKVLIVDDFGRMKSGEYLKKLVTGLSIVSLVCLLAAVIFYLLYSSLSRESGQMKKKLVVAEKKVSELVREREILMARLVILEKGEALAGLDKPQNATGPEPEVQRPPKSRVTPNAAAPVSTVQKKKASAPVPPAEKTIEPRLNGLEAQTGPAETQQAGDTISKTVAIEKFTVTKDGESSDLLVRFDIRNISGQPGDVSGRIFTVLKPESNDGSQWLVVPSARLKDGVPSEYRKGQYFSIAHFKPVKFRIKNHSNPDFFKKASIFIFNNQGDLMVEKLINITEAVKTQ